MGPCGPLLQAMRTVSNSSLESLFQTIREGPAILMLGQAVLRKYAGEDYFLSACASRFGLSDVRNYNDLLGTMTDRSIDHDIGILHNISMHVAVPEPLMSIAQVSWNAVLTSCFHEVLERAFTADWRRVDSIFSDQRTPSNPRSRTQLHLLKLFGCVTRDQEQEQPPLNGLELLQRQAVASSMLGRLNELVTPRGVLLIDAIDTDDWLRIDTLAEQLRQAGEGPSPPLRHHARD